MFKISSTIGSSNKLINNAKSFNIRHFQTVAQTYTYNNFSNINWKNLSDTDKMNYALAISEPEEAEIAFYKGLALKNLGKAYAGEAINNFEKAAELDKNFDPFSHLQIANIQENLGQQTESIANYKQAYQELLHIIQKHIPQKMVTDDKSMSIFNQLRSFLIEDNKAPDFHSETTPERTNHC